MSSLDTETIGPILETMRQRDILWQDTLLTFVRTAKGGMEIVPTEHGIERAQEFLDERCQRSGQSPDEQLMEMLEQALGNGWSYVRPEDIGALTDAPILSQDGFTGDDGKWYPHPRVKRAKVYAHMNYAVEDPIEMWAKGKSVFFQSDVVILTKEGRAKALEMWNAGQ
jgi:hypothetical protein